MLRGDGEVVCISCGKALAVRTVRVAAVKPSVKYTPAPSDPQIRFVRLPHGEITQEFE